MGIECNPGKHDNGDKLRQSSIDFSTDSSTIEFVFYFDLYLKTRHGKGHNLCVKTSIFAVLAFMGMKWVRSFLGKIKS